MKDEFFLDVIKQVEPQYIEEDIATTGFIDTGSYALNALTSASIWGGFPNNRVTGLAGEQSVGKTFFALSAIKKFLVDNPLGGVIYFDTEFALDNETLNRRDIPTDRMFKLDVETIQEFRTKALNILDNYGKRDTKPPLLVVLDSYGNLSTTKEVTDSLAGAETRDMTRAQIGRALFRTLLPKLGKYRVPMIATAHTYQVVGSYVPMTEIGGGGGLKYGASTILTISRHKDKDETGVVGNILKVKSYKSRYSKMDQQVELRLNFHTGLDRYYGLLPIAEKHNIIKKVSTRYEMPDGSKVFGKAILENPEKFFTKDILDRIEAAVKIEFGLGENDVQEDSESIPTSDNGSGESAST